MKDPNKSSKPSAKPKEKNEKKYTRGIFKKTRGGVPLTKEEVKEIKAGRKKLRAELRKIGEKDIECGYHCRFGEKVDFACHRICSLVLF